MKNSELINLPIDRLKAILKDKKSHYLKIKYNHKIELNKNSNYIRYTRRFIARILTILNKKEISS